MCTEYCICCSRTIIFLFVNSFFNIQDLFFHSRLIPCGCVNINLNDFFVKLTAFNKNNNKLTTVYYCNITVFRTMVCVFIFLDSCLSNVGLSSAK